MKILNLIDRSITRISVLEDMRDVSLWLNDHQYLAIIDEELQTTGIVTLKDLRSNPDCRAVIDCSITKPQVRPNQTIFEVFKIMKEAGTDFLPVYDNNVFIGMIALMTITERLTKAVSETKQVYQKVIHDLRNPLGNLQGLMNILTDSISDTENLELINLCNLSCKHAMDILDDLIYVEVDESKTPVKQPTEMSGFYKQCINEQLGLTFYKDIKIVTEFCGEKITKSIDRNMIKRTVQNVISNAIKFSYPHSTIKIFCKIEDDKIILKIVDAGIGIPANLQPEIFKKFTTAQREGTNGEGSTGLGLCFTKECLEQHNGNIEFKSIEGKGTKFYITL